MDPPEHTGYRQTIDDYFNTEHVAEFEPTCRHICTRLVSALPRNASSEIMFELAHPFAVQVQCAFLGWPESVHEPLLQ